MVTKDLVVYKKSEQLLHRIYPRLRNFPKSEKQGLALHIKENFFDMLKFVQMGNSVKSKRKEYLQSADGHLQTLKVLMHLAFRQRYLSSGFFKEIDLDLTEINKLLSGYIRSTS